MAGFHFNMPTAEKGLFEQASTKLRDDLARSLQLAVAELAFNIKQQGDADISTAGNFSARWTRAFTVRSTPALTATTSDKYTLDVFFTIPYAHIHEFGGVIKPKGNLGSLFGPPMLWIPLSFAHVPKSGGNSPNAGLMTAQEYGLQVSPLFRVNRKGKAPLLLSMQTRKPIYFGLAKSTIPQRFHIRDICRRNVDVFKNTFSAAVVTMRQK